MNIKKMDAGDKKNTAGEQVHLSNKKDNIKMGSRRGSWSAGFANQKILLDFWAPKINYFRGNSEGFWL